MVPMPNPVSLSGFQIPAYGSHSQNNKTCNHKVPSKSSAESLQKIVAPCFDRFPSARKINKLLKGKWVASQILFENREVRVSLQ